VAGQLWVAPVPPALRDLRITGSQEFKVSLGNIERPYLKILNLIKLNA
jgi:hypothetical protein